MTPAEAIEAAELAEAEIRYRNELAREMTRPAGAALRPRVTSGRPPTSRPSSTTRNWRPGAGGLAAVSTSPTRARATSRAGSNPNPNANWKQAHEAPSRT